MITIKIIFRKDKINNNNEHPLYLRLIKNRRPKYISLGICMKAELWDEKNNRVKKAHPNSQRLNNYIATKVSEAQDIALKIETNNKSILPEIIKDEIMGKNSGSFFKYADKYLRELDLNEKVGTYRHTKSIIDKMKIYTASQDLLFDNITVSWLKSYEQYLRTRIGNKINTVNADFRTIRRIINAAINEEVISDNKNPFRRFKMTLEKVKRDYLTEEELMMIELAPLQKGSKKDHHRNMYIFSAYAGGLRISDILLLKWKNFDGERIIIQTKKTSSVVSIKLPMRALELLNEYQKVNSKPDDFIFPMLKNSEDYSNKKKLYNALSSATTYTNKDLRSIANIVGLEKKISFHTARHTFATRALLKGMRIEYVSKIMGHSNISVTQLYTKIVNEELDKAMEVFNKRDKVIESFPLVNLEM